MSVDGDAVQAVVIVVVVFVLIVLCSLFKSRPRPFSLSPEALDEIRIQRETEREELLEEKALKLQERARIHRHNRLVLTSRKESQGWSRGLMMSIQERWDSQGRAVYGDSWDKAVDGNLPLRDLFSLPERDIRSIRQEAANLVQSVSHQGPPREQPLTAAGVAAGAGKSLAAWGGSPEEGRAGPQQPWKKLYSKPAERVRIKGRTQGRDTSPPLGTAVEPVLDTTLHEFESASHLLRLNLQNTDQHKPQTGDKSPESPSNGRHADQRGGMLWAGVKQTPRRNHVPMNNARGGGREEETPMVPPLPPHVWEAESSSLSSTVHIMPIHGPGEWMEVRSDTPITIQEPGLIHPRPPDAPPPSLPGQQDVATLKGRLIGGGSARIAP